MNRSLPLVLLGLLAAAAVGCGGGAAPEPAADAATPAAPAVELPVDHVDLGALDAALAAEGQALYETRCSTCHKMDERYVGPPLGDVVEQRGPEYVMNMILAPEKMLQVDETAKALLAEYAVPMTNQNLSHGEARAILEYLRRAPTDA